MVLVAEGRLCRKCIFQPIGSQRSGITECELVIDIGWQDRTEKMTRFQGSIRGVALAV